MAKKSTRKINGRIWSLITGILMVVIGIYVWFNPTGALLALAMYLGIVFTVSGIGYLFAFAEFKSGGLIAMGLINALIGVIFMTNLGITAASLPIVFGLWTLAVGIIQTARSFDLKALGFSTWTWTLGSGVLGIIFGLLIFAHPMIGAFTLSILMGSYLILYGALSMSEYFLLKRR